MKAVQFIYFYPLPDEIIEDLGLSDEDKMIAYAQESLAELVADEGFQADGMIVTIPEEED